MPSLLAARYMQRIKLAMVSNMIVLFHHRDKVQGAKEKFMNMPCNIKPHYCQVTNCQIKIERI